MVIIVILLVLGGLVLSFVISMATIQNRRIGRVLELRDLERSLLFGETDMRYITDDDLYFLGRSSYSHVGMDGVGPCYIPSFPTYLLVKKELYRRRSNRLRKFASGKE